MKGETLVLESVHPVLALIQDIKNLVNADKLPPNYTILLDRQMRDIATICLKVGKIHIEAYFDANGISSLVLGHQLEGRPDTDSPIEVVKVEWAKMQAVPSIQIEAAIVDGLDGLSGSNSGPIRFMQDKPYTEPRYTNFRLKADYENLPIIDTLPGKINITDTFANVRRFALEGPPNGFSFKSDINSLLVSAK